MRVDDSHDAVGFLLRALPYLLVAAGAVGWLVAVAKVSP